MLSPIHHILSIHVLSPCHRSFLRSPFFTCNCVPHLSSIQVSSHYLVSRIYIFPDYLLLLFHHRSFYLFPVLSYKYFLCVSHTHLLHVCASCFFLTSYTVMSSSYFFLFIHTPSFRLPYFISPPHSRILSPFRCHYHYHPSLSLFSVTHFSLWSSSLFSRVLSSLPSSSTFSHNSLYTTAISSFPSPFITIVSLTFLYLPLFPSISLIRVSLLSLVFSHLPLLPTYHLPFPLFVLVITSLLPISSY